MRLLSLFIVLILFSACRKEDIITSDPSAKLQFSADTILFDTVFTSTGSTSRRLKIYNHHKNAIKISRIELAGSNNSFYQININGQGVNSASNVEISGKDSISIFIKVFIDPNLENAPFIVSDSLQFLTNGNKQSVQLRAYGLNANFYHTETLRGNLTWSNDKPYVIYNSVIIDENSKLTIRKGTKIYFHKGSKMLVAGTLQSEGDVLENISFSGDRLESAYMNEPGQWGGIHFLQSSTDNIISYTIIKNALVGIRVDSLSNNGHPKLILNGTIIKNMQVSGLIMYNAEVSAFNNLIYNCGLFLVYGAMGGNYNFKQNTFAGFNFSFSRQNPAVYFADYYQADNFMQTAELNLTLTNNIIWGNNLNELILDKKSTFPFKISAQNNLIKSNDEDFINNGNILNTDPLFLDPRKENYGLSMSSPAINKGLTLTSDPSLFPFLEKDLKSIKRIFPSEIGCYEFR
jgi:hypothetical protein